MDDYEEAVLFTFGLLESRLDRIEYLLTGGKNQNEDKAKTIPERIQKLERTLKDLSTKTFLFNDVQKLLSQHADLIKPASKQADEPALEGAQKTAIVVERAPSFASIASQLKALDDQQIPSSDGFAKLAKLRPRIAEAEERHLQQALQIADLRRRSGMMTSRYKKVFLAGQALCWIEWQERLMKGDQRVKRVEFKHKQEQQEGEAEQG